MPQKAAVQIKDGKNGSKHLVHAIFSDEEWARLRADWLSWLESGKPTGGAYKYNSNEMYSGNEERELLLRFDEIKAIA
jgi:hypothetical protein